MCVCVCVQQSDQPISCSCRWSADTLRQPRCRLSGSELHTHGQLTHTEKLLNTHTPATRTHAATDTHSLSPVSLSLCSRTAVQPPEDASSSRPQFQSLPAVTVDLTSPYFVDMGDMGDPPKSKTLLRCLRCDFGTKFIRTWELTLSVRKFKRPLKISFFNSYIRRI